MLILERGFVMGLQVYTATKDPIKNEKLFKLHADSDKLIINYVKELESCGYKIIEFPGPEKFRNYFISNVVLIPPPPSVIK
jgi:hypothetical protein